MEATEHYVYEKWCVTQGRVKVVWIDDTGIPGTLGIIATIESLPMPVATVWWRFSDHTDRIAILNSYVMEAFRRMGLRTLLHQAMVFRYPAFTITTQSANDKSKPWLEKNGFVKTQGGWHCPPQEPAAAKPGRSVAKQKRAKAK